MLSATIDGVSLTLPTYIERDWSIRLQLGSAPNEARIKIRDDDLLYRPTEGSILELRNEDDVILFDGLITIVTVIDTGIGRLWDVVASGWTWELDRRIVQGATYLTTSDQYVITATESSTNEDGETTNPAGVLTLTNEDRPVYDTTNVDASPILHPPLQFEGDSVRSILDELSRGSGYIYWIDPGRVLNYKLPQNLSHSGETLSDRESVGHVPRNFRVTTDITQLVTRVLVIGGFGIRPNEEVIYPTLAGSTLLLGYRWTPDSDEDIIHIERNTGTDDTPIWVEQTVGVLGETYQTPRQVTWDPITSTLSFETPLTDMNNGVLVRGSQRFSAITRQDDLNAIAKYGVLEGVVKDKSLITRERVLYKAQAILNESAQASFRAAGALNVYIPVGRLVTIDSLKFGVKRDFVVTGIDIRPEGVRELFIYELTGISDNVIQQ